MASEDTLRDIANEPRGEPKPAAEVDPRCRQSAPMNHCQSCAHFLRLDDECGKHGHEVFDETPACDDFDGIEDENG